MTDQVQFITTANDTDINTLGRLHIVSRAIKEARCRECTGLIQKGEPHFNQNVYGNGIFPVSSKVCQKCGEILISRGCQTVDDRKKKEKPDVQEKIEVEA